MDRAHHPGAGSGYQTICGASARDRWHFAKDVNANAAQPRTRWSRAAQSPSSCSAEGGVLSDAPGPHFDRAVAWPVPLVGKTFVGVAGKPCPSDRKKSSGVVRAGIDLHSSFAGSETQS